MAALWGLVLIWIVCAGVVGWARGGAKLLRGEALVPWEPRRAVPWALLDLLLVILTNALAAILITGVLKESGWRVAGPRSVLTSGDLQAQALANSAIPVLGMAAGLALVVFRTRASARDLGWSREHVWQDVKLGLTAFVMLAPPVFAVQAALVQFWESKHPLMEMFKAAPEDEVLFGLLVLAAVVVAPAFEELLFRVWLQGWLEKVFAGRRSAQELILGEKRHGVPASQIQSPESKVQGPELGGDELPIVAELADDHAAALRGWSAWLPIAISSMVFALLHWQHGPDWIPLTLLAAGMGYVYQRTHRILPSLVVHLALNGLSMWGLWIQSKV